MCVICRQRLPKVALARFIAGFDGAGPVLDPKQQAPGRGVYLCDTPRCREAFSRRSAKRKAKGQEV